MKILLMVSLILNLALAALLAVHSKPTSPNLATENPVARTAPASAPADGTILNSPTASTSTAPANFDWRVVESDDYRRYIANLRAIGCPEKTIRDIIIADVNELFARRKQALKTSTNKFEFWKTGHLNARMPDPDQVAKEQALLKEKRALLKELLGLEPDEPSDLIATFNPLDDLLDFLPKGKQIEVMELLQKFQAKMRKDFPGGSLDAEDVKQIQKAQQAMEAELAKILTPQQLEDYQLRRSETAQSMRGLEYFDFNEQEFRDVFKVRKKFDDDFYCPHGPNALPKAEREEYYAAKKEMNAQIRSILGDTRYADYERAQDWAYQGIGKVAEQQGLSKESAVKVYDINRVAVDAAASVRNDKSLSSEQRAAALQAILAETEKSIRAVFGDQGFQSYQKQPGVILFRSFGPIANKAGNP